MKQIQLLSSVGSVAVDTVINVQSTATFYKPETVEKVLIHGLDNKDSKSVTVELTPEQFKVLSV